MSLTAAQIAAQRKQLERELAEDLRKKDRQRIRELRDRVAAIKKRRREARYEVRQWCKDLRIGVRDRARAAREAVRERMRALRDRVRELRAEIRELGRVRKQIPAAARAAAAEAASSCDTGRAETRARLAAELQEAEAALAQERTDQKRARLYAGRAKLKERSRARGRERAEESDDEVRNNISPELVPVFERVKRGIRGSLRRTRTEAFLEWVHDHPNMVWEITNELEARELERLEREERKLAREMRKTGRYRRSSPELAAALEAVPF